MTEDEWLTGTKRTGDMLRVARGCAGRRKVVRLKFECLRLVWDHLDLPARVLVERFEAEIDRGGPASTPPQGFDPHTDPTPAAAARNVAFAVLHSDTFEGLKRAIEWTVTAAARAVPGGEVRAETIRTRAAVCGLFREIVGNPFRPWKVAPDFLGGGLVQPDGRVVPLTDTVRLLAAAVYADQAFDRLPILADAAEEAGVTDPAMLDHLRHGPAHVRGCWALDLLSGRG